MYKRMPMLATRAGSATITDLLFANTHNVLGTIVKTRLCSQLSAVGVLMIAGMANAAPPAHYVNRENSKGLWAYSDSSTPDGYMHRELSATETYDTQGLYVSSQISVTEYGFSNDPPWNGFYRTATCNVERGAIQLNGAATVASLSAYISADDMTTCYTWASNVDPFSELVVNASFSDPESTRMENVSGIEKWSGGTYGRECRYVGGYGYQFAASVNDQSWMPLEGETNSYNGAGTNVCNYNLR